jgi:hypothetical protein
MARDWPKVALAALAAVALGAGCLPDAHAQAPKPGAKSAKAPATQAKAEEADDAEEAQAKTPAAAKKKQQDPAEAQRAVEGATKLLQAGKTDQAVQSLSAVLAGGNLPPAIMAKALYARGLAHRQQGKPAQAISDLTSALWLKGGLPEAERADALQQRAGAYRDAGLSESGEAVAAGTKERTASSAKSWNTTAQEAPTGQTGGNWFNNLFKLQPSAPSAPPPAPPPQPAAPVQETASIQRSEPAAAPPTRAAAAPRIGTGWSSTTQVKADREPPPAPRAAPPSPPAPQRTAAAAPARPEGRFRVQLAAVRTQDEARALAAKAKREHGAVLAAREPEIDQAVLGNMGSFYRVRVGPFATVQETQAVCARLKGSGFDCMTVTQ